MSIKPGFLETPTPRFILSLLLLVLIFPACANESTDSPVADLLASQQIERFPDPWLMRGIETVSMPGAIHMAWYFWEWSNCSNSVAMNRMPIISNPTQITLSTLRANIDTFKITEFNIDSINAGKMLFFLYQHTGDNRYRLAMDALREQLEWQPRTHSGGFWHKRKYPWQIWLDGLYMAQPFYAQFEILFVKPIGV